MARLDIAALMKWALISGLFNARRGWDREVSIAGNQVLEVQTKLRHRIEPVTADTDRLGRMTRSLLSCNSDGWGSDDHGD